MLSIGGTSPAAMERHTANWGLYEETARANGHVPARKNWRVVGMFHIAETREQARQNVRFGVQPFADSSATLRHSRSSARTCGPYEWLVETGTGASARADDAIAYIDG